MDDMLSTLKSTNRLINVVGGVYAKENGYDNCILLNRNKSVVEVLNGNLFVVKENVVKTPPLKDGCVKGIIRERIIEIVKTSNELQMEETSISPFELLKADELFITNAIIGIQPITHYRKKIFKSDVAKGILGKLSTAARMDLIKKDV